jgi:hypothetical protein
MRIITDLTEEEFKRLQELSAEQRRPVRDQAAYLLSKALSEITQGQMKTKAAGEEANQ